MRLFRKLMVCFGALLVFSVSAFADSSRFSLFGDAELLTGGLKPDGSAHLTSSGATFSGIRYRPNSNLTFGGLTQLSTDFRIDGGDCGGGSPRIQVRLDLNGNGISDPFPADGNIFIYMGPYPNFNNCVWGWQSTGNLIGSTDLRFDLTQVGGAFYDTYATALTLHSGRRVLSISVVVDGGWTNLRGQAVDVDNFRVNNHVFKGKLGDDD